MIFVDESIQYSLGYICVGFAYCEDFPNDAINEAISNAGLTQGVDEYKSGYRMTRSNARHTLRDSIYRIVLEYCKIGLYIADISERPTLLTSITGIVKKLIETNELKRPQIVFVDEGICGNFEESESFQVSIGCDSKKVLGIQLADFVAYHCSYLLKCALTETSKKVLIEGYPHPLFRRRRN